MLVNNVIPEQLPRPSSQLSSFILRDRQRHSSAADVNELREVGRRSESLSCTGFVGIIVGRIAAKNGVGILAAQQINLSVCQQ